MNIGAPLKRGINSPHPFAPLQKKFLERGWGEVIPLTRGI